MPAATPPEDNSILPGTDTGKGTDKDSRSFLPSSPESKDQNTDRDPDDNRSYIPR